RTLDMDRNGTLAALQGAYDHPGSALIEIYQNCNVFNDKAFLQLTGKEERVHNRIDLVAGEPVIFDDGTKAVIFKDGGARIVDTDSVDPGDILIHDPTRPDPTMAFALSRLSHGPYGPTPLGIFRDVTRPVYDEVMAQQLVDAQSKRGPGDMAKLIRSLGTWEVK
ncbi:MAG: 2-oxoacid:ferredoxin oxidoreductase subunit beta, partial [Acidimicrobiia bacterium]|nr:2-oxoacid:ferredoxin oxidoreductase subunit beta [Acidimicrobiia bacterium]